MAQSVSELKKNRGTWRRREIYRYARWQVWHKTKNMAARTKWWNLFEEARHKRAWYDKEIARHAPKAPKEGLTYFDGHPVASWIVPILQWARAHGWTGYVVSGYRTRAQQWAAAVKYGLSHYPGGNPFFSNHLKYLYPGGAVDVYQAEQLNYVLRNYPGRRKLHWAYFTIRDYPHFSANAH